ncbi:MAG: hypothetical protein LAQ30_09510, partial [Acidobacteriia bacterium]|nr:hypothetical protein [Terriglobia bacterium]
ATINEAKQAAAVVRDAGGRIVGRTRLQKISFILEAAGLGTGFPFKYKYYGPYSEELSAASDVAGVLGLLREIKQPASWGGSYSTYTTEMAPDRNTPQARLRIAQETVNTDAVELELAATALFLTREGVVNPWDETARRKPDKAANGRLQQAKQLYERLRQIQTPQPLPRI